MKTKNLITYLVIAAFIFSLASCSKSSSGSGSGSTGTDAATQADDQTFYTNETDYATNDAGAALTTNGGSYSQERPEGLPLIPLSCDAAVTVDTNATGLRTITITYDGANCSTFNHERTGTIVVSFYPGFRWGAQDSSLTITFNLTVQRISPAKTITITGTRTITNLTGGLLSDLLLLPPTVDSVAYGITDNTTVTFDTISQQRSWQTSLRRTYTADETNTITILGGLNGTNRFGGNFSAAISEPLIISECNGFLYASGQVTYSGALGGTSTTTFGLTTTGAAAASCSTNLYYQFIWNGPNGGKYDSGYVGY